MHSAHAARHTLHNEALMSQSKSLHLTPGLECPDFNPKWRFLHLEKASGFTPPTPESLPGADGEWGGEAGVPERLCGLEGT